MQQLKLLGLTSSARQICAKQRVLGSNLSGVNVGCWITITLVFPRYVIVAFQRNFNLLNHCY